MWRWGGGGECSHSSALFSCGDCFVWFGGMICFCCICIRGGRRFAATKRCVYVHICCILLFYTELFLSGGGGIKMRTMSASCLHPQEGVADLLQQSSTVVVPSGECLKKDNIPPNLRSIHPYELHDGRMICTSNATYNYVLSINDYRRTYVRTVLVKH